MSEELPPAPGEIPAGSRLAGYLCEEEIGRGGMAVVYRAHDDRLDRQVAVKLLAPELARDEQFRQRFMQESRIAAAVDHPNIIPVFGAGETDGVLYIAMRYVPDGDVRTLIDRSGPLPVAQACALIAQVASALDAAHARGLVHRDVKPTNMLLELSSRESRPDHVYLSDFGLAKPPSAAKGLTLTGQFFGTADYAAPEQIQGQPLDGRTDQYALACAAFEMLCGAPPFKRETGMAVISAQLAAPPPSLTACRPDLPTAADTVIAKALAKAPADRYDRCLDFADALVAACLPGPADTGPAQPPPAVLPLPTLPARPVASATVPDGSAPLDVPDAAGILAGPAGIAASADLGAQGAGGHRAGPPAVPATIGALQPGGPGPGRRQPGDFLPGEPQPPTAGWWPGESWSPLGEDEQASRARRRSRGAVAGGVVALLVILFLAAGTVTYLLLRGTGGGPTPAGGSPTPASTGTSVSPSPSAASSSASVSPRPPRPMGPSATVLAYFSAINHHRYLRAWRLGGKNTGSTYSAFVSGFSTTAHDTVTIQSVSGNVVTAQISALQTDGTIQTYQGTYTVSHGIISHFDVRQTG